MISKVTSIVSIAVVLAILPSMTAAGPVTVEVHMNLIPDGDFTTGSTEWDVEGALTCADDLAQGQPLPSLGCSNNAGGSGDLNCSNPLDPNTCNSNANVETQGGVARRFTLPPVFLGTVQGARLERFEVSMDYRATIGGGVTGATQNRNGNANVNINVNIRNLNGQDVSGTGIGGTGAGSCCGNFNFNSDSFWQSSPRSTLNNLADYSGQDMIMVIQVQCRGDGHENGSGSPVGINVDCGVRMDNVRLEAVFSTP